MDDEFVALTKLTALLSKYGKCDAAANSSQALDLFDDAIFNFQPYNLITIDIELPGINGIDTLKKVREWEKRNNIQLEKGVKVMMMSAAEVSASTFPNLNEGCEEFIPKPFNGHSIAGILNRFGLISD